MNIFRLVIPVFSMLSLSTTFLGKKGSMGNKGYVKVSSLTKEAIIILYASFFHEITANVVVMSIKRLLHSLIAVYLACFLTTQEKYFYPRPTCIFRI